MTSSSVDGRGRVRNGLRGWLGFVDVGVSLLLSTRKHVVVGDLMQIPISGSVCCGFAVHRVRGAWAFSLLPTEKPRLPVVRAFAGVQLSKAYGTLRSPHFDRLPASIVCRYKNAGTHL